MLVPQWDRGSWRVEDVMPQFLYGYKHGLYVVHNISHSPLPQLNWNCLCCHSEWNDHSLFCYLAKGLPGVLRQLVLMYIFVYVTVCLFSIQFIDYLIFLNQAYLLCFHIYYIHCGQPNGTQCQSWQICTCATTNSLEKPWVFGSAI